jgi:trk system potassium uptake protein TrkA
MRVVIAGAGRLGQELAEFLVGVRNEVTVIEVDDEKAERLKTKLKARVLFGDACEPSVLEEAGALNADILMATTGDDEDNLVISLLAKRQFNVPRIVARVNFHSNEWLFTQRWGVDVAVSASSALMSLIKEATGASDTIGLARLRGGDVALIETTLTADSNAVGKGIGEIPLPQGSFVAAIVREGVPTSPTDELVLQENDEVIVLSESATESDVRRLFQ